MDGTAIGFLIRRRILTKASVVGGIYRIGKRYSIQNCELLKVRENGDLKNDSKVLRSDQFKWSHPLLTKGQHRK